MLLSGSAEAEAIGASGSGALCAIVVVTLKDAEMQCKNTRVKVISDLASAGRVSASWSPNWYV